VSDCVGIPFVVGVCGLVVRSGLVFDSGLVNVEMSGKVAGSMVPAQPMDMRNEAIRIHFIFAFPFVVDT